ncbi:MAG: acetate kinase [Mycoplasma sp.]|nr:acetate kinase [Mycoplasma sp.]
MSKLLVVNAGSSSMKFKVFERDGLKPIAEGLAERIFIDGKFIIETEGNKKELDVKLNSHADAVKILIEELISNNVVSSLDEIIGIGHRVVQGGETFKTSSVITKDTVSVIRELSKLAPLHNPPAASVMEAFFESVPNAKNVAVFDTSYHQTMPMKNFIYGVPMDWYKNYSVRRYGMHGTSHKYMAQVTEEIFSKKSVNVISCHLGNGASITAIKDSKSINTSMGLTPLAGIIMGTRSGDIDPAIVEYMVNETGKTVGEITTALNKESGVLGISGISSDFRDIEAEIAKGNKDAIFAMEIYAKRIAEFIVKYHNDLEGKTDAIVFTAGIGENSSMVRAKVIEAVKTMGLELNEEKNNTRTKDKYIKISSENSKVDIYVIKTDEELMIVKDLVEIAKI